MNCLKGSGNLCDADYYTCRHLYQRVEEHNGSVIRNNVREQHGRDPNDINLRVRYLKELTELPEQV